MGLDVAKLLSSGISGLRTREGLAVVSRNHYVSNPGLQARLSSYDTFKQYQAGDPCNAHKLLGDNVVGVIYDRLG